MEVVAAKREWIVAAQEKMRRRQAEAPTPIPARFLRDYQRQALQIISSRVRVYADQMHLTPLSIKVNRARRRWGSCSHRGALNFSYRLMAAPLAVIDYVVVHELAHMKHLNHSRAFWNCVASVMPEFRNHHQWLREHGHRL
jgi:predicted metal-dependent hydrolase